MAVSNSSIEWTDSTWSPVTGCTKVSAGCDNCYAETIAHRFAGSKAFPNGFEVTLHPERLEQPLKWRKPRQIFVNSMSDLFHDSVPDEYIAKVFAVMAQTPQHTYQILTKRHARMRSLLTDLCRCGVGHPPGTHFRSSMAWASTSHSPTYVPGLNGRDVHQAWPLPNVWLGVSVENQQWADIRVPALLDTPAAVRWISAEPLLGPIDLHNVRGIDALWPDWMGGPTGGTGAPHPLLDWVVVGGESGPGARPMHPAWARALRDQCQKADVPFLFKQWGAWRPEPIYDTSGRYHVVMPDGRDRGTPWSGWGIDQPDAVTMERVGKGAAGRELDGRTWDEFPETVTAAGVNG